MENRPKTIENLEEEMKRLREEIERKKKEAEFSAEKPISPEKQKELTSEVIKEHLEKYPAEALGERYKITEEEKKKHIEKLEPEEHDRQITELMKIAEEKGYVNAYKIALELNNPHLTDDLQRAMSHKLNFEA